MVSGRGNASLHPHTQKAQAAHGYCARTRMIKGILVTIFDLLRMCNEEYMAQNGIRPNPTTPLNWLASFSILTRASMFLYHIRNAVYKLPTLTQGKAISGNSFFIKLPGDQEHWTVSTRMNHTDQVVKWTMLDIWSLSESASEVTIIKTGNSIYSRSLILFGNHGISVRRYILALLR